MARYMGHGIRDGSSSMARVTFAPAALRDLERLRAFLRPKNPLAARRAAAAISEAVRELGLHPQIGRPVEEMPEYRELLIDFGDSGYIALCHHSVDQVTVLAQRHQREAGYRA